MKISLLKKLSRPTLRSFTSVTLALILAITMSAGLTACKKPVEPPVVEPPVVIENEPESPPAESVVKVRLSDYVCEVIDENGNSTGSLVRAILVPKVDEDGKAITDENGEVVYIPKVNEKGEPCMRGVGGTGVSSDYVFPQKTSFRPVGPYLVQERLTPAEKTDAMNAVLIMKNIFNFVSNITDDVFTIFSVAKVYAASSVDLTTEILQIYYDTNVFRAAKGLPPLVLDLKLCIAASIRAMEITINYSHNRLDGSRASTVLAEVGAASLFGCGENISMGYLSDQVVIAWSGSDAHAKNMASSYETIGIGFAYDEYGIMYCVQLFSREFFEPVEINEKTQEPEVIKEPEPQLDEDELEEITDDEFIFEGEITEVISEDSDLGFKEGDTVDVSDLPPGTDVKVPDGVNVIGGEESTEPGDTTGPTTPTTPTPTEPTKPTDNGTWVTGYYKTVHHDAEYKTVNHPAEYQTINHPEVSHMASICKLCGAELSGNFAVHFDSLHPDAGFSVTRPDEFVNSNQKIIDTAAWTEQKLVKGAWDEQVLVKAAWDEQVWVDYGHNHYKGQWCDYCKKNG